LDSFVTGDGRGVLYPAAMPTLHRLPPHGRVSSLVRWFWIPEWDIAPGRVSRQELLAFPACNLAVEPTLVGLAGPTTRRSNRDLTGRGWTVGALLRPAAVPHLTPDPYALRDRYQSLDLPDLHRTVAAAMIGHGEGASVAAAPSRRSPTGWSRRCRPPTPTGCSPTLWPSSSTVTRPCCRSRTRRPA